MTVDRPEVYACVPAPRLAKFYRFYRMCREQVDMKQIKAEAWLCKKFMVLLKRKKHRKQVPRCPNFRALLALLPRADSWLCVLV